MKTQTVIKLTGNIVREIEEANQVLARGESDLILDFAAATFISVEGLEWLEELLLRSKSSAAAVGFVNIPPTIYKVFKVAHVESLLEACGALTLSGPVC